MGELETLEPIDTDADIEPREPDPITPGSSSASVEKDNRADLDLLNPNLEEQEKGTDPLSAAADKVLELAQNGYEPIPIPEGGTIRTFIENSRWIQQMPDGSRTDYTALVEGTRTEAEIAQHKEDIRRLETGALHTMIQSWTDVKTDIEKDRTGKIEPVETFFATVQYRSPDGEVHMYTFQRAGSKNAEDKETGAQQSETQEAQTVATISTSNEGIAPVSTTAQEKNSVSGGEADNRTAAESTEANEQVVKTLSELTSTISAKSSPGRSEKPAAQGGTTPESTQRVEALTSSSIESQRQEQRVGSRVEGAAPTAPSTASTEYQSGTEIEYSAGVNESTTESQTVSKPLPPAANTAASAGITLTRIVGSESTPFYQGYEAQQADTNGTTETKYGVIEPVRAIEGTGNELTSLQVENITVSEKTEQNQSTPAVPVEYTSQATTISLEAKNEISVVVPAEIQNAAIPQMEQGVAETLHTRGEAIEVAPIENAMAPAIEIASNSPIAIEQSNSEVEVTANALEQASAEVTQTIAPQQSIEYSQIEIIPTEEITAVEQTDTQPEYSAAETPALVSAPAQISQPQNRTEFPSVEPVTVVPEVEAAIETGATLEPNGQSVASTSTTPVRLASVERPNEQSQNTTEQLLEPISEVVIPALTQAATLQTVQRASLEPVASTMETPVSTIPLESPQPQQHTVEISRPVRETTTTVTQTREPQRVPEVARVENSTIIPVSAQTSGRVVIMPNQRIRFEQSGAVATDEPPAQRTQVLQFPRPGQASVADDVATQAAAQTTTQQLAA